LHGRIIEDRGVRPTSEKYGIYEYERIVSTFTDSGFVVISEARAKDTIPLSYAKKVASQIDSLLALRVAAKNITVVGASKGAGIAILVSHLLKNSKLRFVILAICSEGMASYWKRQQVALWGRVLHIYDHEDKLARSCEPYWDTIKSRGLVESEEIELQLGLGHGISYRPYKAWVEPAVRWAKGGDEASQ
jgi:hypothetical protein